MKRKLPRRFYTSGRIFEPIDITCRCSADDVGRQRIFRRRVRISPHARGPLETRPPHRDVERSSAKSLGVGRLQGNLSSPRYLEAFPPPGHHEPVKFKVPTHYRIV